MFYDRNDDYFTIYFSPPEQLLISTDHYISSKLQTAFRERNVEQNDDHSKEIDFVWTLHGQFIDHQCGTFEKEFTVDSFKSGSSVNHFQFEFKEATKPKTQLTLKLLKQKRKSPSTTDLTLYNSVVRIYTSRTSPPFFTILGLLHDRIILSWSWIQNLANRVWNPSNLQRSSINRKYLNFKNCWMRYFKDTKVEYRTMPSNPKIGRCSLISIKG